MPVLAETTPLIASTDMYAKSVTNLDTEKGIAQIRASEVYGLQPKYLHHNL